MVSNPAPESARLPQVNDVPVSHAAIDSRVLAHRCDDNTVGQLESADPKRSKQNGHANLFRRRTFSRETKRVATGGRAADVLHPALEAPAASVSVIARRRSPLLHAPRNRIRELQ
jgi:hypothetical protein